MSSRNPFETLAITGFRYYIIGNIVSLLGTWAQRVALFWLAWDMTQSTAILGLLALFDLLPAVLISPLGGMLADRPDRLRMAIIVQYLSVTPPLLLTITHSFGVQDMSVIFAASLLTGIFNGLDDPLRLVLVSSQVPRDLIPKAVATNSITFNVSRMIGPVIGGWAIAADQIGIVFVFNALSYVFFAVILARIVPLPDVGAGSGATLPGFGNGWHDVLRQMSPLLKLTLVFYGIVAFSLRPVFELLPAFAASLTATDSAAAGAFSLMSAAVGLGAVVGAVSTSFLHARMMIVWSGLVATAMTALLLLTHHFTVALIAVAFTSAMILINGVSTQIVLQTGVPERIRGKVMSVYAMTMRGMPALGSVLIGYLVTVLPDYVVALCLCLPVVAMAIQLRATIRNHRR